MDNDNQKQLAAITAQLADLVSYNKLQVDLLERLLANKQQSAERNLEVILSIFSSNPMFAKLGITDDVLRKAVQAKMRNGE